MLVFLGIVVLLFAFIMFRFLTAATEVTIDEFVDKVKKGEVTAVDVNNDVTEFRDKEGRRYKVVIHYNVEEIVIVGADGTENKYTVAAFINAYNQGLGENEAAIALEVNNRDDGNLPYFGRGGHNYRDYAVPPYGRRRRRQERHVLRKVPCQYAGQRQGAFFGRCRSRRGKGRA